ncbi:unnamed protein product, partial [Musa hybrid cultivar]
QETETERESEREKRVDNRQPSRSTGLHPPLRDRVVGQGERCSIHLRSWPCSHLDPKTDRCQHWPAAAQNNQPTSTTKKGTFFG